MSDRSGVETVTEMVGSTNPRRKKNPVCESCRVSAVRGLICIYLWLALLCAVVRGTLTVHVSRTRSACTNHTFLILPAIAQQDKCVYICDVMCRQLVDITGGPGRRHAAAVRATRAASPPPRVPMVTLNSS